MSKSFFVKMEKFCSEKRYSFSLHPEGCFPKSNFPIKRVIILVQNNHCQKDGSKSYIKSLLVWLRSKVIDLANCIFLRCLKFFVIEEYFSVVWSPVASTEVCHCIEKQSEDFIQVSILTRAHFSFIALIFLTTIY